MFFKRFKTLLLKKNITKILKSRTKNFQNGKVNSVGIIFDYDSYHDYNFFHDLMKDIGVMKNKTKFIAMIDLEKDSPNSWDAFFSIKNFDWLGRPKSAEIDEFVNRPFDVLISYYNSNKPELNFVTALSNSNFKIGLSDDDARLNDLVINIDPLKTDIFKTEIIKYLTHLNRL